MTKFYLFLIMFFVSASLAGQNYDHLKKGYIHLKNGEIIKGSYIYSPLLDKIQVVSGKTTTILESSEVEKITKSNPNRYSDDGFVLKENIEPPRFLSITEFGVLAGNADNEHSAPFSAGTSLNYFFHRNISAGVGVGVDFLKETYLPVTANVLYKFKQSRTSPFVMLQVGYQVPIDKSKMAYQDIISYPTDYYPIWSPHYPYYETIKMDSKGGFLINPSVGIMMRNKYGYGLSLSVGYRFHRLRYVSDSNSDYKIDIDYNRLSLKLGIIFN